MESRISLFLILLLSFSLIHAKKPNPETVDKNASLGKVIAKTKEMYERGEDKRKIAEWLTGVIDKRIICSNNSEALRRPIWASMQVYWTRNDPSNSGEYNDIANASWSRQYGNCEENSAVAYYILKKAGVKENVRVLRTKSHSFCVWDMPATAVTNDPSTWGEGMIVDPWYGSVLDGSEARDNYWFQNGDPENRINDATRDIDLMADDWRVIQKREEHRTGQIIVEEPETSSEWDCFIASAVYGTPQNNEIDCLRDFRDDKLRKHLPGRIFISFYERFGPFAAFYIAQKENRKEWARKHIVSPAIEFAQRKTDQS